MISLYEYMFGRTKKTSTRDTQKSVLQYRDPTGEFSSGDLVMGTWYVKNKLQILKFTQIFLIVLSVIFGGYSLFVWGYYLFFGYRQDANMHAYQVFDTQNYDQVHLVTGARALEAREVTTYTSGSGLQDFVVNVTNPNDRYVAIVRYKFTYQGGETPVEETIILPQTQRPVVALGHELSGGARGPAFVIVETNWRLIDPHVIPDPISYRDIRQAIHFDNLIFTRGSNADTAIAPNRIVFDVFNDTAYGFWESQFLVELYNGGNRVGIVPLRIDELRAGASEQVDLRTFIETSNVSDIRLIPITDVFDPQVFMSVPRT